ncbi:hypothetical protein OHC33_009827 [Knufia fluminis]|uniref:Tat pathway signal sequence n=1 Tax=Knufia fluminis TaxID=191047 RepID=A0AAN8I4D7_9EURO|nr:hypothetical protein OHC33_009827 [Knufia fluminis]
MALAHNDSDSDSEKQLLRPDDDTSASEVSEEDQMYQRPKRRHAPHTSIVITILNVALFCASSLVLYLTSSRSSLFKAVTDQDHYLATSAYSPILDRFDVPKTTTTVNGSLYQNPPSLLRDTGKAGDDEWFRIGTGVFPIVVNSDEVRKLGKNPALAVKIPEDMGYGSDAYIAQTDVFHHLHCVDMLRREIYHPWSTLADAEKLRKGGDRQHWAHVGHCIDILAQAIKCSGSVDMIMFNWVEGWDQPFPDFATKKVCRDFDALLKYVNDNSIPHKVFEAMKEPPEGYVRLPEPGGQGAHMEAEG